MIYIIVFVIIIAITVVLALLIQKRDRDIEIIDRALIIPTLFTALIVIATYSTNRNNFDSVSIVIEFVGIIMVFMTYAAHRKTHKPSISICLTAIQYLVSALTGFVAVLTIETIQVLLKGCLL